MKKSLSILSLFMLVVSSMIPVGVGDAYYLNGNEGVDYPKGTDIPFYDVAGNKRAIMSYNLGATSTDIEDKDSYGLFFQWGNNHGFPNEECYDETPLVDNGLGLNNLNDELVVHDTDSPGVPGHGTNEDEPICDFETDEFTGYWDQSYSWSGSLSQGPCPEGYHVPSMEEWNNLFVQWCEDDEVCDTRDLAYYSGFASEEGKDYRGYFPSIGGSSPLLSVDSLGNGAASYSIYDIVDKFTYTYNLPLAGFRNEERVDHVGRGGHYWTRTSVGDVDNSAWHFEMSSWGVRPNDFNTYNGESVRCFSGSSDAPTTLALDLYRGGCTTFDTVSSLSSCDKADMLGRVFVPENEILSSSKIEKLNQYDWYTTNVKNNNYLVNLLEVQFTENDKNEETNTIQLYGFLKCGDDKEYVNGECKEIKRGTTVDESGDYKCLANGAEYDEDSGQCVYKVSNSDGSGIVIMSSNLGATQLNPMGDFYQWGNDYRYPRYPSDAVNSRICGGDGRGNEYCPLDGYDDTTNENTDYYRMGHVTISGWSEGDQGPCPEGYHVPTLNEWTNLLVQWCENDNVCDTRYDLEYDIDSWYLNDKGDGLLESLNLGILNNSEGLVSNFMRAYNLSLGGIRNADTIYYAGKWGGHRSSSIVDETMGYSSYGAVDFGVEPGEGVGLQNHNSGGGLSVRCFSDATKDMGAPIALNLYSGSCGGGGAFFSVTECNHEFLGRKFVQSGQVVDATALNEAANLGNPREGYQRVWYLDVDKTTKLTADTSFDDDEFYDLYVFEEVATHTIKFDVAGGTPIESIIADYGTIIDEAPVTTKNGYRFAGWYDGNDSVTFPYTVQGDVTLKARWTKDSSGGNGGYSGGGGHSGGSSSDNHKDDNKPTEDKSSEDKPVVNPQSSGDNRRDITSLPNNDSQDNTPTNPQENNGGNGGSNSSTSEKEPQYTQETLDAYGWAYANGLTKYSNVKDARLDEYMNRSEMAKISTIFATQFRGETPDESKREFCSQFSDLWKVEEDTKEYIIQSCELGNMGYQANGVDELQRFRPYTPVSLAETSIILSRMLWGNKYAVSENKWYQGHLWAVYEHRLIDNISKPFNNITRKDAFIMLYRLSFSKDVIRN